MESRRVRIYNELFNHLCSKQELAEKFRVTTKTIENTIKKCDDIGYSKKIGSYYFKDLLPRYISYQNYFNLFSESVTNPKIREDFIKIGKSLKSNFDEDKIDKSMIDTNELSELSKKIIKVAIAINHSCILKVAYSGNKKPEEVKYIRPHRIFTVGSIYYLSLTYDKKNKKNIGEERQFAFNGIESIEPIDYLKDEVFKSDKEGNAFGNFDNEKTIKLILKDSAANFFKREGLFETYSFDYLSELSENKIEIKMHYNDKLEVIKLVQQWLPQITIADSSEEAQNIINDIKQNYQEFIDSL